jgi:hypothetical protein
VIDLRRIIQSNLPAAKGLRTCHDPVDSRPSMCNYSVI